MNSSQTFDPRKELCDELAERLRDDEGHRSARLLQALGWLDSAPEAQAETKPVPKKNGPHPISIWQPREVDGELCFERPAPMALGDHYAATRRLIARKTPGTRRVALFGESVAAGYLYAPHLTPAQLLDAYLQTGEQRFEVIDLARTNESLRPLCRTLEASLQLDPDLFVLFVGNNWNLLETPQASPQIPSIRARQGAALALRQGGVRGLVERAERQLAASARLHLARIAEWTRGRQVVVILPEVNLADWENRQPVPWLPGEAVGLWYRLHDEGLAALERREPETARIAAEKMFELDQGICSTSHRMLGRAWLALDRPEKARRAFQAEVDANAYASLAFLGAPQATTQTRQLLAEAAQTHSWGIVDLRQVFQEEPEADIPGRELFLDYCHLSSLGMRRAMAAVATSILGCSVEASKTTIRPTPEQEALACFGAALHNAHRLVGSTRQELIEQGCRQALAASPEIADTLRDVVLARCSGEPAVLHAAQQRNFASAYRLLLQHGWRWDHLDAEVLLAIRKVLAEVEQPIDQEMDALLLKNHGQSQLDLSRAPYLWQPLERLYPEVMDVADLHARAFYRALWPRSSFCLIASAQQSITLQITARLPSIKGAPERLSQRVKVLLNGRQQTSVSLDSTWRRHEITFLPTALKSGLNRLTLHWPNPQPAGEIALAQAVRRLEEGLEADLHPLFGEIFALHVRPDSSG